MSTYYISMKARNQSYTSNVVYSQFKTKSRTFRCSVMNGLLSSIARIVNTRVPCDATIALTGHFFAVLCWKRCIERWCCWFCRLLFGWLAAMKCQWMICNMHEVSQRLNECIGSRFTLVKSSKVSSGTFSFYNMRAAVIFRSTYVTALACVSRHMFFNH